MKKLLLISVLLISVLSFSQKKGIDRMLSAETQEQIESSGNTNIDIVTDVAAITAAGANAYIEIQTDIVISADFTPPTGQTWDITTGSINYSTYTLTLDDTKVIVHDDHKSIFGTTGTVAGTVSTPKYLHVDNFGATADLVELYDGVATSSDATFTSASANFTANDVGKPIAIQGADVGWLGVDVYNSDRSLITTIASVANSTTIELSTPATRSISNALFIYGTDNFDALKVAAFFRNQKSGDLFFGTGTYFRREVEPLSNPQWDVLNNGLEIGVGSHDLFIKGQNTILRSIPHDKYLTFSLTLKNTKRTKIEGISLQGEKPFHNYSNHIPGLGDEGVHGLYFRSAVNSGLITQMDIFEFEGDGFTCNYELQFNNYIQGANHTSGGTVSDLTIGDTNDDTGVRTPNASSLYAYTTNLIDISGTQYENARALHPTGKGLRMYSFSGSSFAGWSGLITPRYWAYYYDASSTFLYKSGEQRFYDHYEFNDEVKYVVIEIEKPLDINDINAQVRSPISPWGNKFSQVNIRDCGRHAFSNLPPATVWENSTLQKAGPNQPGYIGNVEDYRDEAAYYKFDNIIFLDAAYGGLNFVGSRSANIVNCKFLGTSEPNRYRSSAPEPTGIGQSGARNTVAIGNYIVNSSNEFDRRNKFFNNEQIGGSIAVSANGNNISRNEFHNVKISNLPQVNVDRSVSHFEDNKLTYDKPWTSALFRDNSNCMIWKDIDIRLNDKTRTTYEIDQNDSFEPIVLNEGGDNELFNQSPVPTEDFGGYFENISISGARPSLSTRDYTRSSVPIIDMKGTRNYFGTGIALIQGLPRDYTIDNLQVSGGLRLHLKSFEDTVISATPTITLNKPAINVDDADFNWTNTGAWLFETYEKNANLIVNNGVFNLNLASSVTGGYNRYVSLKLLGFMTFNNPTFYSESIKTIDFTNTTVVGATAGDILIIDPVIPNENITFTLRSQDHIVFTKTSPLMATYALFADDAAAAAAGYPSGYLYMTAIGEQRIKL